MNNIFNNAYGIVIVVYLVGENIHKTHAFLFGINISTLFVVVCVIGRFTVTDS